MLLERIGINEHVIKLVHGKQPSYKSIYSLGPIELKTFKTYIITNLANNLIIKNQYPLLLISESLNWLKQAKCFTQLNFISTYYWIKIKKSEK